MLASVRLTDVPRVDARQGLPKAHQYARQIPGDAIDLGSMNAVALILSLIVCTSR